MFSDIAPRYDLLNHLLALNLDRGWRRRAVDRLLDGAVPDARYLDACAGTMDLSRELAGRDGFDGIVVASDFAAPMLDRGRPKVDGLRVRPVCADALRLPHPTGTFQGVIVGFGVRNFVDLDAGLAELRRVLRPGGRLVILELSLPRGPLRPAYLFYFNQVLPRVGRAVSGHAAAYAYLPDSVREFPSPPALAHRMEAVGFESVRYERLLGGVACIHLAER